MAAASTASATEGRSGAGNALAGFLLSGFLLALLGALLPAWGYHRDPPEFTTVGNYFLCLAIGIVASAGVGRRIMGRRGLSFLMVFACAVACAALAVLAAACPPASAWWRALGLAGLGFGAGLLNMALFYAVSRRYGSDAAGTVTRGGIWHGLGCLAATLLVACAFYLFNDPSVAALLALMAALPGVFALVYAKNSYAAALPGTQPTLRQALADFRSPGAVLFALLLFFQFGNEWSIAGWLPMFLMRRVGLSLKAALFTLSLYWLFLLVGRLGAIAILPRVRHGRLLTGSVLSALFGCMILYSTKTGFGAASGAFFVGAGYASVYPLVAEAIGRRFPYYHPGFFNGIFSVALLGGLLAPATLGYAADAWGVGVVIGIPLLGTCMVMLLVLSIWLESKVTGR
jgi:MFS transporter, FHS family, glucose/mannose:H+ symporter